MTEKRFSFLSSDQQTTIQGYRYTSGQMVRGVIVLVHGMKDYIGRYQAMIEWLTQAGYVVVGYDQIGHGLSAKPEDLGYFGKQDGITKVVSDLQHVVKQAKVWYPQLPLIVCGHSFGSLVTRKYLGSESAEVNGAIIMGTLGIGNPLEFKINVMLLKLLIKVFGPKARHPFISKLSFKPFNQRITNPHSPNAWLTRDKAIVDKYDQDPLSNFMFTFQGFLDILQIRLEVNQPSWANKLNQKLRVMLLSGELDACGEYGKTVTTLHQQISNVGIDCTLKLYPDDRHELFNELDQALVYQDLVNWLNHICIKWYFVA